MSEDIQTPPDTTGKVAEAAEAVKKETSGQADDLITLSTGVKIRAHEAPPGILIRVMANFKRPKAPALWNETTKQHYQNPDHPDHIEAVQAYDLEYSDAMSTALLLYGTEIVKVPKGFPGPNSEKWIEELELIGLEVKPDNKSWRKLNWLLSKAIANADDYSRITTPVGAMSGVPEEDVEQANRFPGSNEENGIGA